MKNVQYLNNTLIPQIFQRNFQTNRKLDYKIINK